MHHALLEVDLTFSTEATSEQFEAFLDRVMEELAKLDYDDVELTAALALHQAEFVFPVVESMDSVIATLSALRTALHASMCATPDWPEVHPGQLGFRTVESSELATA